MIRLSALLLAAAVMLPATPAFAETGLARGIARDHDEPSVLSASERRDYRAIFDAIHEGAWAEAADRIDEADDGPLTYIARAELYLAKGSPRVELEPLMKLLSRAPEIPEAAQLGRLAKVRGAEELPPIAEEQKLVWAGSQPRRERANDVKGDPVADELDPQVQQLIVDDKPGDAEALLNSRSYEMTPEGLTEFRQRIAWSYYLTGDDANALRMADDARGGSGEWALQAEWVAGLAAWRLHDCTRAADRFAAVGSRSGDPELMAAGNYWAARADMMCGRPERVQVRLRMAASQEETFYGLLARTALGIKVSNPDGLHDFRDAEWKSIAHRPNVRAAIALNEIGERALADEAIKHQARISPGDHNALLHLASDLNLPATQFWLAHNAPRGTKVNISARYPMPDWRPTGGWRVDPALVYAHALQESSFRTAVVSPAGAMGLMQVRPGTAADIARERDQSFDRDQLTNPAANIEYGQTYLESLRDASGTGGLLPKVIAAYNCGPAPVAEWNTRYRDQSDPLLYIESIPYWETRGYVPIILRNYWIYQEKEGEKSTSRPALVQNMWPRFPGLPGPTAVRLSSPTQVASRGAE